MTKHKPVKPASETSVSSAARAARDSQEGRRRKKPKSAVEAAAAERVGDHAITPELVRGEPYPARRNVRISTQDGPAAAPILADLMTVLWSEIRGLREAQQQSHNGRLSDDDAQRLRDISDATTKVLREERRQHDLDDWSRMTEDEIIELLPPEYQAAFKQPAQLPAPAEPSKPTKRTRKKNR